MTALAAAGPAARASVLRGSWVAALWVVVLFSNIPSYIEAFVSPALVPLHWIIVLLALAAVQLRWPVDQRGVVRFLVVLTAYEVMCLAWYVAQGGGDPIVVRERLLGLAVCAVAYMVFASSPSALRAARVALAWVVVFSAAVNVWDITHPFSLIPADSEFSLLGRAAGFFINPNQSGAALVVGFALSVSVVPRSWRIPYLVMVAVGVVLTFSRAALIGLVLVSLALAWGGRALSLKQLGLAIAAIALVGWIAWLVTAAELESRFHIDPDVAADRLLWILDPTGRSDYSQEEREVLVERGWYQFERAPFTGNGVGSTELWEERSSTHDEYVMLASDFGFLGLLAFPFIIFTAMGMRLRWSDDSSVAGLFLLFWGLFSHNVLTEAYLLLAIGLLAALARAEADGRALETS